MATSDSPLNVPNVTLAVARGASGGSGGTSALSWSALDGNTNNGSRIRIASDGTYALGTKPGGPHELHDFGHTAYERGTENTFNSGIADETAFANTEANRVWTDIVSVTSGRQDPVLKSEAGLQRHSNASRFYRLFGANASLREPKAFEDSGRAAGHKKLYHAWWQRNKYNATYWRDVATSDLVGTFQPDEPIEVNGGEYTGVYVGFHSGQSNPHRIVVNGTAKNNNTLNGKVVTGLTSGATMTFDSGTLPGQYKLARHWDNPDGTQARGSISINDGYIADQQTVGDEVKWFDTVEFPADEWQLFELEVDLESTYYRHTVNGRVRHEESGFPSFGDPNFSLAISQIGTDGQGFEEQLTDFSEHVFDRTLYRVYLGNAADWVNVTHREVQRLIAWDGSVDIALNYGALASGWLYLIGADGQPINSSGLEVA